MIKSGTVLIQTGAVRPQCFEASNEVCPPAWMSVQSTLTPPELEAELSRTGWTFFFMANHLKTRAFGFDPGKRLTSALTTLVGSVREQGCNCIQIDAIAARSFLGVPYTSVSAHPRHLQKGTTFVAQ
jgi:hypothetical protein